MGYFVAEHWRTFVGISSWNLADGIKDNGALAWPKLSAFYYSRIHKHIITHRNPHKFFEVLGEGESGIK